MADIKQVYQELCNEQRKLKAMEREFNEQSKKVTALREMMLSEMTIAGTVAYKGSLGTLSIRTSEQPVVNDWDALYQFILQNKAFDLLQRRVSSTAYRDRLEDGEVPGVTTFEKQTLFVTLA